MLYDKQYNDEMLNLRGRRVATPFRPPCTLTTRSRRPFSRVDARRVGPAHEQDTNQINDRRLQQVHPTAETASKAEDQ